MEHKEKHGGPPAELWRPSGVTISAILLVFALLLVGAFAAGYLPLQRREATVRAEADEREKSLPRMTVMRVRHTSGSNELSLPGTMQAVTEAPILARAEGYLKRRLVDIGDQVKQGQLLAEIDAPELDQQTRQAEAAVEQAEAALEQAQANLEQGKANRDLARTTSERWTSLACRKSKATVWSRLLSMVSSPSVMSMWEHSSVQEARSSTGLRRSRSFVL